MLYATMIRCVNQSLYIEMLLDMAIIELIQSTKVFVYIGLILNRIFSTLVLIMSPVN